MGITKRFVQHFPVGVLNAAIFLVEPLAGATAAAGFLGYEYIQEWRKEDNSHKDVYGWVAGLFMALGVIGVLKIANVL